MVSNRLLAPISYPLIRRSGAVSRVIAQQFDIIIAAVVSKRQFRK
jgi:hypothetical protein